MSRFKRFCFILVAVIAFVIVLFNALFLTDNRISNIADIYYSSAAQSIVTVYEESEIVMHRVDESGNVTSTISMPRTEGGLYVTILDTLIDDDGFAYVLKQTTNTDENPTQTLEVYNLENWMFKHVTTHEFTEASDVNYRWLSMDGSIFLSGTNGAQNIVTRESYDAEQLRAKLPLEPKYTRTYQIDADEGIYEIEPYGEDLLFIAKSGKLFLATEGAQEPTEVYPARELDRVMYPMFVDVQDDTVIIGEQESGDILTLDPQTTETAVVKRGTEPFTGNISYTPVHLLAMSMEDVSNFMAVAKNNSSGFFEILVSTAGQTKLVRTLDGGFFEILIGIVLQLIIAEIVAFLLVALLFAFAGLVKNSKTIIAKLTLTSLPLLIVALVLFGVFSYYSNKLSVLQSSEKQVQDEGNLLAALFGAEIFNEMEYPYDYTTDAYDYLLGQIGTRTTYTRTAYFERETLFTGVDFDAPLFYPFEIGMNTDSTELFMRAVETGVAQTGLINDENGIRFSCVTPIGGISGGTIYLIETGTLYSGIEASANTFLLIYIGVAALFLLALMLSLHRIFKGVIDPIGKIKAALEEFSHGNTAVRLEVDSSDELSDIVKVFNNMASDIDLKMYDLQKASKTYYRFIPQKVFALLGKQSLDDIKLGNSTEAVYNTLTVSLSVNAAASTSALQDITNECFNIISETCERQGATLVVDSVNLRRLQIVCPEGANSAVDIALSSLSRIDGVNAKVPMQSRVKALFVVHKTRVYYGICGDEDHFIPSIISKELDYIAENEELFREFATRLIVTSAAFEGVEKDNYFYRFIGNLGDDAKSDYALYDFYDASSTGETHLINETKATFDKAMQLYTDKRYYEAKSLFAVVLRENQYDNVARYYIFKCERNI